MRIQTDQILRSIRATMDLAHAVEMEMRKHSGKERSKLESLFFQLVKIRANMIDTEDRIRRQRHPEDWK